MATQAEAINKVNNWFDTMNFCQMRSIKKLACRFGIHHKEQQHALNKMEKLVKTMRIKGKKSMLPFQKGFLISISAMRGLHVAVSGEGVNFIMTTHVTQANLENVFSRICFVTGNYSHPSPVEFPRHLRILMLGGNHDIVLKNPSVMDEERSAMANETNTINERSVMANETNTINERSAMAKRSAMANKTNMINERSVMGQERNTDYNDPSTDTLCMSKMAMCHVIDQVEPDDFLSNDDMVEVDS